MWLEQAGEGAPQLDENGQPIPTEGAPVQLDENGQPIAAPGAPEAVPEPEVIIRSQNF